MIEAIWFFFGFVAGAFTVTAGVLAGQLHTNALKRLYAKHDCRPKGAPPR